MALAVADPILSPVKEPGPAATATASKIWNLYGLKGLETMEMPPVDTPVGNRVRYHVKTGVHSITPYDWEQFYNFADELFK